MTVFRKIDTTTGNLIEDCVFESHPFLMENVTETETDWDGTISVLREYDVPILDAEGNPQLDPQYVEEAPPQGFYLPRWTGTEWFDGGVAPDPVPPVPPDAERFAAIEEAIDFLVMGGM